MLQSSTFDKVRGVLLQNRLVKHFWKENLLIIVAKGGVLAGRVMKK